MGIEILSVALYVLAGSDKTNIASNESAFKYFLMGAFASGFLLFGIALIYGYTGTFSIENIARPEFFPMPITSVRDVVLNQDSHIITVGIILILIGLGFKISAAPFHFWAPDVYTGAPTPITALMSTVVKTAAIGAFFRLMYVGLAVKADTFTDILAAMTVLTLLIGNVVAVSQSDVKRMLAFHLFRTLDICSSLF
ncbi:MAG: hypothetical protein HC817_02020 [Saprospiraceae bacterium]|nr:hypothetical protein [Saprospiraceae bacterium]